MKPILAAITILATGLTLSADVGAGPRRAIVAPRANSAVTNLPYGVGNGVGVQRRFYGAHPYYYQPYYPPVAVMSPYAPSFYILAPTVVANQPYFCVLHNEGFFSRIGLIDHLAGTHKIPLDAATDLCPDGVSCIFPSY